jgi:hypothetical protein
MRPQDAVLAAELELFTHSWLAQGNASRVRHDTRNSRKLDLTFPPSPPHTLTR